ncbi:MAG: DNA repair protein RecO [Bacteroidota bacterium]
MLITTKGIVFRFVKYRETSIIATIYTEELGLNSYIINGVRSAKSNFKIGYFESLNLVELTAYHKPDSNIDRLKEIKSSYPLQDIRQNIYKSSISMFLAEIVNRCIVEKHKNEPLFNFLYQAIIDLENNPQNNSFHLQFLLKLTTYLGFGIHTPESFIKSTGNQKYYDDPSISRLLQKLLQSELSYTPELDSDKRQTILNDILQYYHLHIDLPKLKSLNVLHTIFS